MLDDYINNEYERLLKKNESIIMSAIYEHGYKFENREEFLQFVKERCYINSHLDGTMELCVDNIPIKKWKQ